MEGLKIIGFFRIEFITTETFQKEVKYRFSQGVGKVIEL